MPIGYDQPGRQPVAYQAGLLFDCRGGRRSGVCILPSGPHSCMPYFISTALDETEHAIEHVGQPVPVPLQKSPGLHVYRGMDGRGQRHCFGCRGDGDGIDWLTKVGARSWKEAGDSAESGNLGGQIRNRPYCAESAGSDVTGPRGSEHRCSSTWRTVR
jgi:hypothetical protein